MILSLAIVYLVADVYDTTEDDTLCKLLYALSADDKVNAGFWGDLRGLRAPILQRISANTQIGNIFRIYCEKLFLEW